MAVASVAYCKGSSAFDMEIFLWGGGDWRGHTSSHTLVMLEVSRHTFGWGRQLSPKLVVCKYQNVSSKKAWQPKLVVFYTKVLRTTNEP